MCEREIFFAVVQAAASSSAPVAVSAPTSWETAITIILTALGVILAALAIIIGVAAIWGYSGIKDAVKDMAFRRVDEAMKEKLREYPQAGELLELTQRLRERLDFIDQVQNQIVTAPESNVVETASDNANVIEDKAKVEAAPEPQPPPPYPGEEEAKNASDSSSAESAPKPVSEPDPGPDHR